MNQCPCGSSLVVPQGSGWHCNSCGREFAVEDVKNPPIPPRHQQPMSASDLPAGKYFQNIHEEEPK